MFGQKRRVRKTRRICRTRRFIVKKRKTPPRRHLITDEICGSISQESNGEFVQYWHAANLGEPLPFGTITISNQSPHCTLTVMADTTGNGLAETTLFVLTDYKQTKSITLGAFASLAISSVCSANQKCSGQFSITAHYFARQKSKGRKKKKAAVYPLRPSTHECEPKDADCAVNETERIEVIV